MSEFQPEKVGGSEDARPPTGTNPAIDDHRRSGTNDGETEEIEYLTGWRFIAIAVAIVLSMFLVSDCDLCVCVTRECTGLILGNCRLR